jgi:hypothetical protein
MYIEGGNKPTPYPPTRTPQRANSEWCGWARELKPLDKSILDRAYYKHVVK